MRGKIKRIVACACTLVLSCCTACAEAQGGISGLQSYEFFNCATTWVYDEGELDEATASARWSEIKALLSAVEGSLSTELAESSVSRFNGAQAGERVEIDRIAYEVFTTAQEVYRRTEGAYNPATGLLVDLWGFSPRFQRADYQPTTPYDRASVSLPAQEYITAFSAPNACDFGGVRLLTEGGKYYAVKPKDAFVTVLDGDGVAREYAMQVNFGGMGKGYCVDAVARSLSDLKTGYFSVGGSSIYLLENHRARLNERGLRPWEVGVNNPRTGVLEGNAYCSVKGAKLSLSSSGDYEKSYFLDGVRYCHILNGNTGYPVNAERGSDGSGIITASVFGLSAVEGDCTSTALMVMGRERALAYVQRYLSDKGVVFLYYDGKTGGYRLYTNLNEGALYGVAAGVEVVRIECSSD